MERIRVFPDPEQFPRAFRELISGSAVYDSSCSETARVWYIDTDSGIYLKCAPAGTLLQEAEMTRFLHGKGMATEVLHYESLEKDWLLSRRLPGEDCTHRRYLEDPKRLTEILGQLLRQLHDSSPEGCPVPDRMERYLAAAAEGYEARRFDVRFFPGENASPEDIWRIVQENKAFLKSDTLLHGDYCLPNVMLDDWRFSGFIDLDHGGIGDRHIDLYWGCWTLNFNLKTDAFRDRFLDAYGRDQITEELLPIIGAFEVFG